jgi:hypothetical protein
VALTNIGWNINTPFEVLRQIVENIVTRWKQTLVTAFEDRNLRLDTFKNMIMRYEIDNCRNQNLFNALIDGNRENHRILAQVWEIDASSFNGMKTCLRNMFNDVNEVRRIMVNNQGIITRQNMVQISYLTKMNEGIQKGFKTIGIRITSDLSILQMQIITQLGQKIDVVNINIQRIEDPVGKLIDVGMKRLYDELIKVNEAEMDNLCERSRNMFLLDAEENKKENNSLKKMLGQGFGYLSNLVTEVISKFDESTDMKLSVLDKNIVIIYEEIGKMLKLNTMNFEELKNEVVLSNKGNDGNLVTYLNGAKIETFKIIIIIR